ncbi:MAG: hypothetical protein FWF09_08000 [Bacteroidales bacterium]|nr:hypothetical protein [Bacteroidales bacterium]
MKRILIHILFLFLFATVSAQEERKNSFRFSGQVSAWGQFTPDIERELWVGARYIPQINYEYPFSKGKKIDFEASANIFGDCGVKPFTEFDADGNIKPYRFWTRYSTNRMEFRAGLQKINFGSAQMLRPLMWFDKMDPRDPLQMTDGVWGGLFRYYFKNNANIWLWGLTMNKDTKGMEILPTAGDIRPEAGGRVQFPINRGETAFSYHTRRVDLWNYIPSLPTNLTWEHRLGFDVRADVVVGLWFETSWTHLTDDFFFKNQLISAVGGDYTIGIGNGLGVTLEHMLYSISAKTSDFENNVNFTAVNLSYPVSLFGNANAILYYDWTNKGLYSFAGFNYQIKSITLYLMGYWNPKINALPMQSGAMRFTGKGVQLMAVWNY